jgi:hypothetical protein
MYSIFKNLFIFQIIHNTKFKLLGGWIMKRPYAALSAIFLCIILLSFFSGCTSINKLADKYAAKVDVTATQKSTADDVTATQKSTADDVTATQKSDDQGVIVKSTDGHIQLNIPKNWENNVSMNPSAQIYAFSPSKEAYIMIIGIPQLTSFTGKAAQDYYKTIIDALKKSILNANVVGPNDIKINGYTATQFEVNYDLQKIKFKYGITFISTDNNFYEVMTWDTNGKNANELKNIIGSFKVN